MWLNDGSGNFTDLGTPNLPAQSAGGSASYGITAVDIDFDGDLDLIEAPGESGSLAEESRVLINRGGQNADLRFTVRTDVYLPDPLHRLTVDTGDVDFDLDLDLIAGGFDAQELTLYENDLFDAMAEDADIVIVLDHTGSMVTSNHDYLTPVKNVAKAIFARKRMDDAVSLVLFNYRGSETNRADRQSLGDQFLSGE